MDLRSVLAKMEDTVKMNPREFLHWIMNIANTSGRYTVLSFCVWLIYIYWLQTANENEL